MTLIKKLPIPFKDSLVRAFPNLVGAKPNFLGIGAAKAGTTTVSYLLSQHPEISFPKTGKELHFFDHDEALGIKDFVWYFSQFDINLAVGEYTPSYLFVPECRDRIYSLLGPEIKFIVGLRNPVDRAFAHHCHAINNWGQERYRKLGYPIEELSFEEALEKEDDRLREGKYHIRHLSYFRKGLYAEQLKRYFERFTQEAFYIYLLEEYMQKPKKILAEICKFLGVNDNFSFRNLDCKLNPQTNKPLAEQTRRMLYRRYLISIEELEDLLKRDLSIWKNM